MATSVRAVVDALASIVGRDRARDDAASLTAAAIDGVRPRVVVQPASTEQVAAVVAWAHDEHLAVCPRGSGSHLDVGVPPARFDVALDLSSLDRVLEWNPDDLTATVHAGTRLGALAAALGRKGQWLPVDPPGGDTRTIGGIVATNASGPLRARYGTMRDLLLGVRFVQSDGVVTWGGARVVKSVSGYDVPKLMVGALGTVGVLAELTVRLHSIPEAERTWLVTVPSFETLQICLDRVADSPLQPLRLEVLDTGALAGFGVGDSKAALAVSFGSVADAVREQGERLVEIARGAGGAATERPAELWRQIERVATAGAGDVVLQIAAPPGRIAGAMRTVTLEAPALGTDVRWVLTGQATVGVLTAIVPAAPPDRVIALVERLRGAIARDGGHVVVRRGPRAVRSALDPWGPVDPSAFALMRRIKAEFDPTGVLNPGRFVGGL
jgi:glycolate oxidase FAD binding subunit